MTETSKLLKIMVNTQKFYRYLENQNVMGLGLAIARQLLDLVVKLAENHQCKVYNFIVEKH